MTPVDRNDNFERERLVACLQAQAELCDRIANNCFDEATAQKYRKLAQECRAAAAEESKVTESTVAEKWPAIVAF